MKNLILKNGLFLYGLIITLILLWPLFFAPYFSHHDDVQVIRLYEMTQCLKDYQIPCRWVPDLGGGFGYPLFNYYAPLPYYFGGSIYLVTGQLLLSTKIMFALPFILAYVFMFLLGRKVWGVWGGTMSAVFYTLVPYHALVFYVRGAMGELWAMAFMPAVIWSLLRLYEEPRFKNSLIFGLFMALLILSHNLTTMIFLPMVGIIGLVLFFLKKSKWFFIYGLISIFTAFMLSAFYLLPVTFERNLVHVDTTTYGYFSYTEHFKGLRKLLLDTSWGWGDSVREVPGGTRDGLSFQIGLISLLGILLSLVVLIMSYKKHKKEASLIFLSILFILISIFMVHPLSVEVWELIPPLKYLQFPWRFLSIISIFGSFVAGSIFFIIKSKNLRIFLFFLLTIAAFIYSFSYFRPEKFFNYTDQQLLSKKEFNRQSFRSIYDYLPISSKAPPAGPVSFPFEIITGLSDVSNFEKGTDWFKFNTFTRSHSIIRVSQYYFPGWRIKVDGKDINIDYNNEFGLMTILLGEGNHQITGRLYNTPVRSIGNALSLIGIVTFFICILLAFKTTRVKVVYYLKEFYK